MSEDVFRLFNEGVTASLDAQRSRHQGDHARSQELELSALAAFQQVLEIDPRHVGALGGMAMGLAQLGRTSEALALFQRAADVEPDKAENYRQLGLCHAELGNIDAARDATKTALRLDSSSEYRQDAAIELYNFGGYSMQLAAGHRDSGRTDEELRLYKHARGMFDLVLEIEPNNRHAIQGLAIVKQSLAKFGG